MTALEINKVYCLDCFEFLKAQLASSVDLIVTDPPYYIEKLQESLKGKTLRASSKNDVFFSEWDHFSDLESYKYFMHSLLREFKRVLKPKGQVYMFMSFHHIHWLRQMIQDNKFRWYRYLIWFKPDTCGLFPNQYGYNYEMILWFRNDVKGGEVKNNIGCAQKDVFVYKSTNINYREECGFHPTAKPIDLVRRMIKNSSNEGDLILDCFMGSGTTAVAAKQVGRNYIGCEISPEYLKIINGRLAQEVLFKDGARL